MNDKPIIHEATYPFIRDRFTMSAEPEDTWMPGVRYKVDICPHTGLEHETRLADGIGSVILEEVARCPLPGRYDERVFYRRRWRDPDGKEFGKRELRVATARSFGRMCGGYMGGEWRLDDDQ